MHEFIGIVFIVMAGITAGLYFIGLKYAEPWKWENIWLVYAMFALVAMPLAMALATVPRLFEAFSYAPAADVRRVLLCGIGLGVGSVLSGLGVVRMGMALGVSVIIGVNAAVGAIVPMAINTPDVIFKKRGLVVIAAVLTLLVGVALVGVAGKWREDSQAGPAKPLQQGSFAAGLVVCVISGVFSAMMNFAFAFGKPVTQAAATLGASESGALNLVWLITLVGSFVPTAIYTAYLLTRNHTWANYLFPRSGRLWLVGLGMALLWYLGVIFYGRGAGALGQLGAVVGWPMFMAIMILVSSVTGFLTGEWKGASLHAKKSMASGLGVLIIASALLGIANQI